MAQNIFGSQELLFQNSMSSQDAGTDDETGEDNPLLFVDVNLGPDKAERIVVFEGDTADDLADRFAQRHDLNDIMKGNLIFYYLKF